MGNNPSKPPASPRANPHPQPQPHPQAHPTSSLSHDNSKKVNRRVSIQALTGGVKSTAADPSASSASATGQPISNKRNSLLQERLQSCSPDIISPRSHERAEKSERSDQLSRESSKNSRTEGQVQVQARDREKDWRTPTPMSPASAAAAAAPEPSDPVQVPSDRSRHTYSYVEPSAPPLNTYYANNTSHLARPPRLPLPIGDSMVAPASPIMAPADVKDKASDLDDLDAAVASNVSPTNTTVEDEEVGDELQPYAADGVNTRVPMTIQWKGKGEKIYVTGTFVNWEKKFKLLKSESGDVFSTVIQLRPGTHHLKFIVDGEMRTSDDLPTAVDFMNFLVNYIEVGAGDIPQPDSEKASGVLVPPGVYPPQSLPESDVKDYAPKTPEVEREQEEVEEEVPKLDFHRTVPQFLVDADKEDEESEAYQRAADIIENTVPPPSLPLFLGRSILNGTTPGVKDDNSVLNYPNHTVLNHLATSSIKNGVLATSVTTRYKRKYVTTIMYKPTGDITG